MKILITGASGFVGGSFMRQFADREDLKILGVARSKLALDNYISMDLSKEFDLPFDPDVVIHAAALASPWGTKADFQENNVDATRNVIAFCERKNHPKLIYLSSSSVFYQAGSQFNLTEDSPIGPDFVNEYAATKYAGEELVNQYGGKFAILRPRAVFGPHDTVLFPRVLRAAKKGALPLFKAEGEPAIGDIIYIDVLCDYLLKTALNDDITGAYNLTNAQPVEIQNFLLDVLARLDIPKPKKVVKVATAMKLATGVEFLYRLLRLSSEPPVTKFGVGVLGNSKTFDVSKMLKDLGPPIMTVEQGVDEFITWQKQNA